MLCLPICCALLSASLLSVDGSYGAGARSADGMRGGGRLLQSPLDAQPQPPALARLRLLAFGLAAPSAQTLIEAE